MTTLAEAIDAALAAHHNGTGLAFSIGYCVGCGAPWTHPDNPLHHHTTDVILGVINDIMTESTVREAYAAAALDRGWHVGPTTATTWVSDPNPDVLTAALDRLTEPRP